MSSEIIRTSKLSELIGLVTNAVNSPHTRRVYGSQLAHFFSWVEAQQPEPFSKSLVQAYLAYLRDESGVGPASRNLALAAIRKLAREAADAQLITSETLHGILQIESAAKRGKRTGAWLTKEEAKRLVGTPDTATLAGKRDRAMLALLLEAGLRREEAATVQVAQLCKREDRWVLADLTGKGGRVRTVPIGWRAAARIWEWIEAAGIQDGSILRAVNKADTVEGQGITSTAVYKRVVEIAHAAGLSVKPHDLRRTYGQLADKGGAKLEQIQYSLGHSSVRTTEIYLGDRQNLTDGDAPGDKIVLD